MAVLSGTGTGAVWLIWEIVLGADLLLGSAGGLPSGIMAKSEKLHSPVGSSRDRSDQPTRPRRGNFSADAPLQLSSNKDAALGHATLLSYI